jgi:hypothetical protein
MTGVLDNLDQAEVFEKAPYFQTGLYLPRIEACKLITGHNGLSFVIEATVLGVDSKHPAAPQVDTRAAQVWNASKTPQKIQSARSTWMGFMCAVYGVEKTEYDGPRWKAISADVLDNNSLKGTIMFLEAHTRKNTTNEGEYTNHTWRRPTAEDFAKFGLNADGSGGAASTPEPMRNVDPSGRAILSHDGGASWVYE